MLISGANRGAAANKIVSVWIDGDVTCDALLLGVAGGAGCDIALGKGAVEREA